MANTNNPTGATPIGPVLSSHVYAKTTAHALLPGEFVIGTTAGLVAVATAGNTELLGVCAGYAKATDTTVLVYDHPDQQYYVQDDGVSGTLAATNVHNNADIVATTYNGTFLKAKHQVDTDSVTSATAQLRILGKHPDDSWADYVRCRVVINEHAVSKKTAGL